MLNLFWKNIHSKGRIANVLRLNAANFFEKSLQFAVSCENCAVFFCV